MKRFNDALRANKASGFSLVELMIVVAIIGILSALAVPRFKNFQAKARQSEAKNNLSHIFTLQQSYHGDEDKYGDLGKVGTSTSCAPDSDVNDIGFHLTNCKKVRYDYDVTANSTSAFTATAVSGDGDSNMVKPGCDAETWTINEDKVLTVSSDVTRTKC